MTTLTPLLRFVSLHSPAPPSPPVGLEIQPATKLVDSLVAVLEGNQKQSEKIASINQILETFSQSKSFFKTKSAIVEAMRSNVSSKPLLANSIDAAKPVSSKLQQLYETLYDNVVVRTLTKGTTNELFKLLCDSLRTVHQRLNPSQPKVANKGEAKILLPDSLILNFAPPPSPRPASVKPDPVELFSQLDQLTEKKRALREQKKQITSQLTVEQQRIARRQMEDGAAEFSRTIVSQATSDNAALNRTQERTIAAPNTAATLVALQAKATDISSTEKQLDTEITALSRRAVRAFPDAQYAQVGQQWVEVSRFEETGQATIEGNEIVVHSANCSLKFPFQVADLRVVDQQTVAYVPGEIIHITNTQQGELYERITDRRKRIKTLDSLITEDETFSEKDSESTEKLTVEKAASEIQSGETSINVNASVSGTYGVVTAGLDAGYSNTQSAQSADSSAHSYARELVQKAVERVSNRVRSERKTQTLEEFRERLLKQKVMQYSFGMIVGKKLRLKHSFERNSELMEMPQEVWIKIGKELIGEYQQNNRKFTPWNKQVNAISGLMSSLQFGMDQGQIEDITDNENIIPLYCYGIDTLDFDLTAKEMAPLVKLAVQEGEDKVRKYFSEKKNGQ